MKHRTYFTFAGLVLASMFLAGGLFAQAVPSLVTQQTRLSAGGTSPNYVQHRAITTVGAAPNANGFYAWDQVPVPAADSNYLLFLNPTNEVHRIKAFGTGVEGKLLAVNATGTNLDYVDLSALVHASNGLHVTVDSVELGGPLDQNTTVDLNSNNLLLVNGLAAASTLTLGNGANTMNIHIDPGTAGDVNMQNIDIDSTVTSMLILDGTGNVRQRDISTLVRVGADNGLTRTVTGPETVIHLGGAATGTAPLLTTRWVDLATFDLNFEGTGNMNLGNTTSNVSTNVNTGTTGNMTLQGTTLYNTAGANNILYVDSTTHDVRSAPVQALTVNNTPTMFLTKDATGNITQSPNPSANFIRGQIAGTGTYTYTSPAMLINSGAAIICTIENHTGFLGAVIVQVTNVTTGVAGTFSVESSENIQTGSFINYTVMNP